MAKIFLKLKEVKNAIIKHVSWNILSLSDYLIKLLNSSTQNSIIEYVCDISNYKHASLIFPRSKTTT